MASPLSLDVGIIFGEFQCLPIDDCSAVSCDSSALARGSLNGFLILLLPLKFSQFVYSFGVVVLP